MEWGAVLCCLGICYLNNVVNIVSMILSTSKHPLAVSACVVNVMESLNGFAVTDSVIRQCISPARLPNSHICPFFLIEALIAFSRYNQHPLDGGECVAIAVVWVLCLGECDVCWQRGVSMGLCGWFHQPECSREILHPHSMSEWQCAACEKGRLMLGDLHAVQVFIWQ